MKYTKLEKELLVILLGAEELIENLDPGEENEQMLKVYKFIHAFNRKNICYGLHLDWREELLEIIDLSK